MAISLAVCCASLEPAVRSLVRQTCAFGLGFLVAGKMLMEMKSRWASPFDENHAFLARFCGATMLVLGYSLYAVFPTADGFKIGAMWLAAAGLLGPTYGMLYLDAIMTPDGLAGDCFLILACGAVAYLGTM